MDRHTILFANDDVLTQWVMTDVLAGAGFSVVGACRAQQVADLLGDAVDFDLLVIDAGLLGPKDATRIGTLWQRFRPRCPIVYTGPQHESMRFKLQRHESFLPTPFGASGLLQAVDRALAYATTCPLLPNTATPSHHVH